MPPSRTFPALPARGAMMALPLALLLALPAAAQVGVPTGLVRPPEPAVPSDPAPAAPVPPDLSRPPLPAAPALRLPMIALPPSMRLLPDGGWRIEGAPAAGRINPATANALAEIGHRLSLDTSGRVTIVSQVAGPAEDISVARRAALANAQAARWALEAGGLDGTRIDLRPLGRTASAEDAIEVLPPGAISPSLNAQSQQAAPRR